MKLYEAIEILNEASISGIAGTMNGLLKRIREAKTPEERRDPIIQLARVAPNPEKPLKIGERYTAADTGLLKEPYKKANEFFIENAEMLKTIPMDVEGAKNAYEALKNTLTAVYNVINAGGESFAQGAEATDKPLGGKPLGSQGQQAPTPTTGTG